MTSSPRPPNPDRPSPGSYRHRYREKPDTDRGAPFSSRRVARTIALGSALMFAALMYLVREIGMDPAELLRYARQAVVFVLTFLVGGVLLGLVIVLLKRLLRKAGRALSGRPGINAGSATDDPVGVQSRDRSRG